MSEPDDVVLQSSLIDDAAALRSYSVEAAHDGERLDRFVAVVANDLSRSFARQLIDEGAVRVDGHTAKPSYAVRVGELVTVQLPPPRPSALIAEAIPLAIVYEDADIVVVDKAAGMVVHPAPGHSGGTLVNALLARYPDMQIGNDLRPGIVHRLDQGTSGLLVVARHDRALQDLSAQQKAHAMEKHYLAVVEGRFKEQQGVIDAPLGRHPRDRLRQAVVRDGRAARTHYHVREELGDYTLLELKLETGRTHQIRVHLSHRGRPVLGDPLYGARKSRPSLGLTRQFLHAHRLGLHLPGGGPWREFSAPLPADLDAVLNTLRARVAA